MQLWSVREDVARDFTGTLKRLAAMGFKGVEFARDYGPCANDPQGLRALLSDLGMQVGYHNHKPEMLGEPGGTLWIVVEQEVYPDGMTPLQSVEASLGLSSGLAVPLRLCGSSTFSGTATGDATEEPTACRFDAGADEFEGTGVEKEAALAILDAAGAGE